MSSFSDRLWLWKKQGLDGSMNSDSSAQVLAQSGWSRSVGGVNPYLAVSARNGQSSFSLDAEAEGMTVYELPSARGCTYVVPQEHYAVALLMAQGTIDEAPLKTATKFLGVTTSEVEELKASILEVLGDRTLHPTELRSELGDKVRSLGEEGKKRGQSTTLSLGLAPLQTQGKIVRVPIGGSFVTQRYGYKVWKDNPLDSTKLNREDAEIAFTKAFFRWCGPTTHKALQWITGFGVNKVKNLAKRVRLETLADGRLILTEDLDTYLAFEPKEDGVVKFVGSLDNMNHLRLDLGSLVAEEDAEVSILAEKGVRKLGSGLMEINSHMILSDGRLIGIWEYDTDRQEVVYRTWVDRGNAIEQEANRIQSFIQESLGDARTFSLDSPASRANRIEAIRTGKP